MNTMTFAEMAQAYCATQVSDPGELHQVLTVQRARYQPTGWLLLQCQQLDSIYLGQHVILPYGGTATLQTIPDHPVSPRGLASDMSVVVWVLPVEAL